MSDPVTNAEIEDVLSSIRRLVSEEPLGDRPAGRAEGDNTGKLVLTPALRVTESEEQAAEADQAESAPTAEDAVETAEPVESEDVEAADDRADESDHDVEAVEDTAAEDPPHQAQSEEPNLEHHRPTGVLSEDAESTLQRRVAELEAALQQVPGEWEPDGSETELSDETEPLSLEAALSDEVEQDAEAEAEAGAADEIEAIAEMIEDGVVEEAGEETAVLEDAEETGADEIGKTEPVMDVFTLVEPVETEDTTAESAVPSHSAEAGQDASEVESDLTLATEEAAEGVEEDAGSLDDAAIDAMFEDARKEDASETAAQDATVPEAPMAEMVEEVAEEPAPVAALFMRTTQDVTDEPPDESASDTGATIPDEPVEDAAPESPMPDEPVAEAPEEGDAKAIDEPVVGIVEEAATEPVADEEPVLDATAEPAEEPASGDSAETVVDTEEGETDEPAETLFEFGGDETLLDEEALREMVSALVRDELQGVLGERITRNVRRLVRREIQRAMALRDLE